jgi:sporulation protein YlmC with PRC-barrel domain
MLERTKMRMLYWELIGKQVRAADGHSLGHVADLVAEPHGESLRVTALLIGPAALARRIGSKRAALFRLAPPVRIPWESVVRIGEEVQLNPDCREATKADAAVAVTGEHKVAGEQQT